MAQLRPDRGAQRPELGRDVVRLRRSVPEHFADLGFVGDAGRLDGNDDGFAGFDVTRDAPDDHSLMKPTH